MRHFFIPAIIAASVFLSCEKEKAEAPENLCPVVAASAVPQSVKDSFMVRYPATTVTTWFNKDNVSYCAFFTSAGVEKLTQFANNGSFIKEQIETNESGEHGDSAVTTGKTSEGCECEIDKEHD